MSEMNLASRMDSYFTNVSMPWEKKLDKKDDTVSSVGALQHIKIEICEGNKLTRNNGNIWLQTPTWAKTYGSQTNILHWCDEQSVLYNGLDNGQIFRYRCNK